jgi:hypothetical protein
MKPTRWLMVVALAACGGGGSAPDRTADTPGTDTPAPVLPAAPDTRARASVPPSPPAPTPQDTGVTPWVALELPSEPWSQTAGSAEALLRRVRDVVAAQLEEPDASVLPTRMESQSADSAVGVLVEPITGDDSVRETEFRLRMRREGGAWSVVGVERRSRCRRGVAAEGLCL